MNSISGALRAYPDVDWRHLFLQMNPGSILDFRNETTWPQQMAGRQDAKEVLKATEQGFNGFMLLEEWEENLHNEQSNYQDWQDYYYSVLKSYLGIER